MLSSFFSKRKVRTLAITEFIFWLGIVAVYVLQIGGEIGILWAGDLFSILAASLLTLFSALLWRSFSPGEVSRRVWGLLTLGFSLWTLGETIWGFYELILGQETPYPSLADVFWLIAYIPLVLGLFLRYRSFVVSLEPNQWWRLSIFFAVILIIIYMVLLNPILSYPDYGSPLEQFLDALYPLSELLLLFFVLLIFSVLRGGRLSISWFIIAIGFVLSVLAETLFSYGTWNGIYFPEEGINTFTIIADNLYFLSYLVIALGIFGDIQLGLGVKAVFQKET